MRARGLLVLGALTPIAVLGPSATARADDAALFIAYTMQQPAIDKAGKSYTKAAARSAGGGATRKTLRATIRADRKLNRLLMAAHDAIAAQAPSTPTGIEAREHALAELKGWVRANRTEMKGLRVAMDRRYRRAARIIERAEDIMHDVVRPSARRALKHFATLGFKSPEGAIVPLPESD